jgi:hypothetical protein
MVVVGAMHAEEIQMLSELREAAVGTYMALGKTVPTAEAAHVGILQVWSARTSVGVCVGGGGLRS